MWIKYANSNPQQSWMVIHLIKDALFALDRYDELEEILKEIGIIDPYIEKIGLNTKSTTLRLLDKLLNNKN